MFATRTGWDLEETPLARALRERRSRGETLWDLTISNPTKCGFEYDEAQLLPPLADAGTLIYEAAPFGSLPARRAVSAYYRDLRAHVEPERICLTTSTSEAYSYLFRLLCDPGDEVLIARPSYPLFDFLATLDDVRLTPYPLLYEPGHGWQIEPGGLLRCLTSKTRAIVVVHPNNPTGHFVSEADREQLEEICAEHGLALIVDEVFLDYSLAARVPGSFAQPPHRALTFVLSGLSKVAGLPQMKAAWVVTCGPEKMAEAALARLEVIADTFLSMNTPVQHALPDWLAGREGIQQQIRERTRENLRIVDALLATQALVSRRGVEGGWYVTLRVPAIMMDHDLALLLLRHGVVVHTGSSFGFPEAGYLVLSLLAPSEAFADGLRETLAIVREQLTAGT